MNDGINALLGRARTELDVARHLRDGGFHEQSVSRAYYAAFYAAEAALLSLGETRSEHSGVLSSFGQLVVKQGGFDPELWGIYRDLFARRNVADYDWLDQPPDTTDAAAIAEPFVEAVARWIDQRAAGH